MTDLTDVAWDVVRHTPSSMFCYIEVLGQRRSIALFSFKVAMHCLSLSMFTETGISSQVLLRAFVLVRATLSLLGCREYY